MSLPERVKSLLNEKHVPYTISYHLPAFTAQGEAAALHVPGKEVAKTVVLRAGNETMLAVLPASSRINFRKLEQILGTPVRLATELEFAALFPDCELGAEPPFGILYSLRVLVDESLTHDEEICFNAGTHRESLRIRYRDFSHLEEPMVCSFADK